MRGRDRLGWRVLAGVIGLTALAGGAQAEDGYDLWLRYRPVEDAALRAGYLEHCRAIVVADDDPVIQSAADELERGLTGMLTVAPGRDEGGPNLVSGIEPGTVLLRIAESEPKADASDGFRVRTIRNSEGSRIVIAGDSPSGTLYGVFALLRQMQLREPIDSLNIRESPTNPLRMVNHWDNINGGIERGYAGRSLWKWEDLPELDPRYRDYARMLASVGLNGTVLNNVNASTGKLPGWRLITPEYLPKVVALAGVFRQYGIKTYLSVSWDSPRTIGGLDTTDPQEPAVRQWWAKKADEIYALIPDFGGFLIKADSEGQPGPYAYGRTHAEGANMLAEALKPHGGIVLWRAFVYGHKATDRARHAYDNFAPLDGDFADNVLIQIKNGPIDFQVREPVSPLFGKMPETNLIMELQITQEYTGFSTHLCYLVPMWKEVLDFDICAKGCDTPVKQIVSGETFNYANAGITGVINTGSDRNWTGHHLAQANTYGFGRLTWDPDLSSKEIAVEWTRLTFGNDPGVVDTITGMLLNSWEIYEAYTSPLGVGVICHGNHYDPAPARRTYYTGAKKTGVGFDRTVATGSGYADQYPEQVTAKYESIESCPDELLLFFHHVPYTHQLHSGKTVIQHIYDSHFEGVERAQKLRDQWKTLKDKVDDERYRHVLGRLNKQIDHAKVWRDSINSYFHDLSGIPDAKGREIP